MMLIVLDLGSSATMKTRSVSRGVEMTLTALVPKHAAKMSVAIEPRQELFLAFQA